MVQVFDWLAANWTAVVIPAVVFIFSFIALLWLRRLALRNLGLKIPVKTVATDVLLSIRWPSIIWCLIISIYLAVVVSIIPAAWKTPVGRGLWTLFLVSLVLAILNLTRSLTVFYSSRLRLAPRVSVIIRNSVLILVIIVAALLALDIWGVPITALILLIAVAVIAVALVFRDVAPDLFAGLQLNTSREIKVGDYIKLQTGEEGYVTVTDWRNTKIKGPDESVVIVPNRRLLQTTVTKYAGKLKRSPVPFRFSSRLHLTELTGLRAATLRELSGILKTAPDPIIYCHTHHFIEEQFYLTPEPANDFAVWVSESLGYDMLGEQLAAVDTMDFSSLGALRDKYVSIIDDYLASGKQERVAIEGHEFHFVKLVSVVFDVPYLASDLREFVRALHQISLGSLYFHVFEARLRLGRGQNDFSIWFDKNLGESELAAEVAHIDPYTYTLEGLKLTLIQMLEKHVK